MQSQSSVQQVCPSVCLILMCSFQYFYHLANCSCSSRHCGLVQNGHCKICAHAAQDACYFTISANTQDAFGGAGQKREPDFSRSFSRSNGLCLVSCSNANVFGGMVCAFGDAINAPANGAFEAPCTALHSCSLTILPSEHTVCSLQSAVASSMSTFSTGRRAPIGVSA